MRWWSFAKQGNTIPDSHANANIYCDPLTDARTRADRNPYPSTYCHANAGSNSHTYANCIAYTYPNTDSHSYQNTNTYLYTNINANADTYGHAYSARASTLQSSYIGNNHTGSD